MECFLSSTSRLKKGVPIAGVSTVRQRRVLGTKQTYLIFYKVRVTRGLIKHDCVLRVVCRDARFAPTARCHLLQLAPSVIQIYVPHHFGGNRSLAVLVPSPTSPLTNPGSSGATSSTAPSSVSDNASSLFSQSYNVLLFSTRSPTVSHVVRAQKSLSSP